jgi:uncharacterized protein (TIGR03083 family)
MDESREPGTKEAIAALSKSHEKLSGFVAKSDAAAFRKQSGSRQWTVADVLSHLGSAAEIGFNTLTSGKADMDAAPAIWDRWNAMSPEDKASNFVASNERLVAAYEGIDDDELAHRRLDLAYLPAPIDVGFLAAMRLSEVGLHAWDIDVAFDPAARVEQHLVPFILQVLPRFGGFYAKGKGKTGTVAFRTTEPEGLYTLELREDGAAFYTGGAEAVGTRVTLPAEALVRLTAGRLRSDHQPSDVSVEGDLSLDDLRQVFPGY